jgi:hypothetical protein
MLHLEIAMPAQWTKGYTYAANATVSAENLGWLTMSATVTLIDRANLEQTNYTPATAGSAQPPGPFAGELWHDTNGYAPVTKAYRTSWVPAVLTSMVVLNDVSSQTWSQGTLIAAGVTDGTYRIANAAYTPFSVVDHGESNVVGVALETISPDATGMIAMHGVWPVIAGSLSNITASVPVMLHDSEPGAAARRTGSGDADRLIGYAMGQPGAGNLPANMFWCKFFR